MYGERERVVLGGRMERRRKREKLKEKSLCS
jgi:hypothetical protein